MHRNPSEEDASMQTLSQNLLNLIDTLQDSLVEEYFGFVSHDIDEVLEQSTGCRVQLMALCDIIHKLGLATPILANSTCDEIDRVEEAIEMYLQVVFDA
jgi:hypothetical protein